MVMYNSKGERVSQAEENRTNVREAFYRIGDVIGRAVKAKNVYRARLVELENKLHRDTYTGDHLIRLQEEARQALAKANAGLHAEILPLLEGLQNSLHEAHSYLDLGNPAFANALKMIEMAGSGLGIETIEKINAQFAFDQPALKALREVYKVRGMAYDGGLDKLVYNVDDAVREMEQAAEFALEEQGSLNQLAAAVGKAAKLEGIEFETLPDPIAVEEAMFRGAGLA